MNRNNRKGLTGRDCPRAKLVASNWLEGISDASNFDAVEVTFKNTRVGFYSNPDRIPLKIGDLVAVEGAPGHDVGRVAMVGRLVNLQMRKAGVKQDSELRKIFRIATDQDLEKARAAHELEHETMIRTRKIAEELALNMKIGDVEYQGDGSKAIFYYIADERVDFRKLIRVLADTFKIRVEMKQIGARQEAGRIGGIGPCGRPLCCSQWMTHFVSVGTGAARLQDISMNPQKLAGQCGKLKCCLNFEVDSYAEASKKLPPKDRTLETADATYYLFKADTMAGKVTYSTDKKIPSNLVTIDAERAFDIIEMNKQGMKPETLLPEEEAASKPATYVDLVEQESLTRFDKSKTKRKKKNNKPKGEGDRNRKPKQEGERNQKPAPEGERGPRQRNNNNRRPRQPKKNDGQKNREEKKQPE